MSKIRVYELAKELDRSSKELMEFLADKNRGVKSNMSSLEDEEAQMLRKAFGKKKEEVPKKEEAPKKKNIVHVFRPQNSRDGKNLMRQGRAQGQRGAGARPGTPGERPQAGRPGARPQADRPERGQGERPQSGMRPAGGAERPQGGARPAAAKEGGAQ